MADSDTKIVITASDQTGPGVQSAAGGLRSLQAESEALANKLRTNVTGNVRNISYQLQDMAVQIGGGTSAMRAMSQQLPQMLMGFGTFGAVVGVAAALIPTLVASFDAAGGSAKTLANTTEDLNKAIGEVGAATKTFNLDGLYTEYNNASVAARQATIEQLKFQQAMIESARIANEKKFGETTQGVGDYSTLEKLKGLGGVSGADKLAKDLGLSLEVAREFLPVLKGLRDGSGDVGLAFAQFGNVLLTGNERAVALASGLNNIAKSQRDAYAASTALSSALQKMGDGTEKIAGNGKPEKIKKVADALKLWQEQLDALNAAEKRYLDGQRAQLDLIDRLYETNAKNIESIESTTAGYQKQIDALSMTEDAILAKEQARLQEIVNSRLYEGYVNAETDALQRQIVVLQELRGAKGADAAAKAAKAAADEWQRAADSIQNSLTDALLRGFESGKGWAQNFVQTLKNLFGTLVLRPIIQGVMAPIAGGITSALGFPGNAAASGGPSLGGMGSLQSALGGLGSFGSGTSISMSNIGSLGLIEGSMANFANIGGQLSAGSIMPALGMAMPYVAAALAIGMAVKGILDSKRGGPKSGGFASSGLIGDLTGADNGRWFTPNNADAQMRQLTSSLSDSYDQMVKSLGGSGKAGFAMGYDTDPQGTAPNRLHAGAYVGGQMVYNAALGDLGRDDAALQAALELESKRALLAALQASDLPAQIAAVFDSISAAGASGDTIDNLLQFGSAMKVAIDAIGGSVVDDAQTAWENSQRTSLEVLRDMGAEVIRLADNMDGSTASMQALGSATADYRQAVVQTLVAIKQISVQIEQMFGVTRDSLETFGLDPAALYDRYRKDADAAAALLATTTDPAQIEKLSARINADINNAFGALDDVGKGAQRGPLLAYLDSIAAMAQERLLTAGGLTAAGTVDPFAAASAALDGAAAKFKSAADNGAAAADVQMQAATLNLQASQINLKAAQTPVVAIVRPVSEVGG